MSRTTLHLVAPSPVEPPGAIHIGDLNRADILNRDWSATHIAADKRAPVQIGPSRRYSWR